MLKSSCLLGAIVLLATQLVNCQRSSTDSEVGLSRQSLRTSSLHFMQKTRLLESPGSESGGTSGGFEPASFPTVGFWPATPLVIPARAAVFIQEAYGSSGIFPYTTFEFTTTSCSASNAFGRYFNALETLRGTPLSDSEKSQIQETFSSVFTAQQSGLMNQSLCMFYDLMACIADYAVQNKGAFEEAAKTGEAGGVFTGAFSCVAEILGTDPTDEVDPFDPVTFPDEE